MPIWLLFQTANLDIVLAEMIPGANDLNWEVTLTSWVTSGKLFHLLGFLFHQVESGRGPDVLGEHAVCLLWTHSYGTCGINMK